MSKIASCFLSVFVCVGLLAATLVETQPLFAAGMQRGGTLTLARPEEPMSLDPFMPSPRFVSPLFWLMRRAPVSSLVLQVHGLRLPTC